MSKFKLHIVASPMYGNFKEITTIIANTVPYHIGDTVIFDDENGIAQQCWKVKRIEFHHKFNSLGMITEEHITLVDIVLG